MDFPGSDSSDGRRESHKQKESDMSSDDEDFQPNSDDQPNVETERERELRSKLLRAKSSRRPNKS